MKLRTIQEWYYRCTNAYNSSEISAVVQLLKLDGCCGTLLESLVTHGRMPSFMTSLRMIVGRKMKMWQMRRSTTRRTLRAAPAQVSRRWFTPAYWLCTLALVGVF